MKSCSLSLAPKRVAIFIRGSHTACYRHSTLTAPETLPGAYWDSALHGKARQNITAADAAHQEV